MLSPGRRPCLIRIFQEFLNRVYENRYKIRRMKHKATLLLWALAVVLGLYVYFLHRRWLQDVLADMKSASPFWRYGAYLALGCIRGFTMVPATSLLLAAMLIIPPAP